MPTYEYKCLNKGHIFEAFQGINEDALSVCEVCGEPVERQISAANFHLKGTGWYVTDYKNQAKTTHKAKAPEVSASVPDQAASGSSEKMAEATTKKLEVKTSAEPASTKSEKEKKI